MARPKKKATEEVAPVEHKDTDKIKCEIGKCFTDKYTGKLYEVGKVEEFTYKRVKEIQEKNKNYIKIIEK